jgi:lysine 6-dehydrogenase
VLEPRLHPHTGDTDIRVMWNSVEGVRDGHRTRLNYYLWDEADTQNGISAMARVTGFAAAIAARLLGKGEITGKGIVPPEDGIQGELYARFVSELRQRGIQVSEVAEIVD